MATKTKTVTRFQKADPVAGRPHPVPYQVTQRYHATRQAGVKAKLERLIVESEYAAQHAAEMARELRKLRPEDFTSVKDLMERGYTAALLKVSA